MKYFTNHAFTCKISSKLPGCFLDAVSIYGLRCVGNKRLHLSVFRLLMKFCLSFIVLPFVYNSGPELSSLYVFHTSPVLIKLKACEMVASDFEFVKIS